MSETATSRSELTSRLRAVTEDLAWAARGLSPQKWSYKPDEAEWSIHEHFSHVLDIEEQVFLPLLRWATVPDMLDPLDYNRRDWHEARYREDTPLIDVVNNIARLRDEELAIYRDMSDTTWTKYREDTRWGPLTCQWVCETVYRHSLDHLQGIMALRQDLNLMSLQPARVAGGYVGERR